MRSVLLVSVAVVALALMGSACGLDESDSGSMEWEKQKIINGDETTAYQATGKLRSYWCDSIGCWFGLYSSALCTATLIAPDVVVSAGHCVDDLINHDGYYVTFQAEGHSAIAAAFWSSYSDSSGSVGSDMVLVVLDTPISDISPAFVMESDDPVSVGNMLTLVGYGCNTTSQTGAGLKREGEAEVDYVSTSYDYLRTTRINDEDNDANGCQGDSGGPMSKTFSDGKSPLERIVGLISRGPSDYMYTYGPYLHDIRNEDINPFLSYHCDHGNRDSNVCQTWRLLPNPTSICGDGNCISGESCSSCPADCCYCGDGICSPVVGESCHNCPADCGTCSYCGDGRCDANESSTSCCTDCGCPSGLVCRGSYGCCLRTPSGYLCPN